MIVTDPHQSFDKVTRITVVSDSGVEFERYGMFTSGIELHLQDGGQTLKIFPRRTWQKEVDRLIGGENDSQ